MPWTQNYTWEMNGLLNVCCVCVFGSGFFLCHLCLDHSVAGTHRNQVSTIEEGPVAVDNKFETWAVCFPRWYGSAGLCSGESDSVSTCNAVKSSALLCFFLKVIKCRHPAVFLAVGDLLTCLSPLFPSL